jgi:hypothetical protein
MLASMAEQPVHPASRGRLVEALVLAASLALAGWFVGSGFARGRSADRFVTVKGVAEREVKADLALWPLRVVASNDDLGRAYASLQESMGKMRAFLAREGIDLADSEVQSFSVTDANAQQFGGGPGERDRFVIQQTLVVRSRDPEKLRAVSGKVSELVGAGVVLSSGAEYGAGGPIFIFSGLNELKPAMIAEATGRAREAAQQFAKDSHSALGGIRRANQGLFEILPRDPTPGASESNQLRKIVRVVTTVDYLLQ